ncbi:MAG: hypothetical protein ABEJ74_00420 [Haloferacaceae archaeon]
MSDEWDDPPVGDDDASFQPSPLVRGLLQVVTGVIIFVALGTFVFGDPLADAALQGLLFGVAYAAIYAAFQYVRNR